MASLRKFDVYEVGDRQEIPVDHPDPIGCRWLYHLKDYPFWILFSLLVPFIIAQGWFLNQALRRHQSVQVVPPMTGFIIVCNALAGHLYYDEGSALTKTQMTYFLVGISICTVGSVLVLFKAGEEKTHPPIDRKAR